MILQERAEGQWLVPGLGGEDRWDTRKVVDFDSVKAVWLSRYQMVRRLTANVDVVIEKSPPNMMRIEELTRQFPKHSFLANNRDPYACCASELLRKYKGATLDNQARSGRLRELAETWLVRSARILDLVDRFEIPLITYEAFCESPDSLLGRLKLPDGVAESIDFHAQVKVKDYQPQGIVNQNPKQLAKLSSQEIQVVSECLQASLPLLDAFGYQLRS